MLWFNFLDFWRMCGGIWRGCVARCGHVHACSRMVEGSFCWEHVESRCTCEPRCYHAGITLISRCHHTVAPMWCYFLAPCVMTIPRRQAFSEDGGGKMHVDDIYLHCRCCHLCRNTLVLPPHTAVAALFVDPGLAEGR